MSNVNQLESEAKEKLSSIQSLEALESFRVEYLGKKGKLASLMSKLRDLPVEEKKVFGQEVNRFKQFLQDNIQERKKNFSSQTVQSSQSSFDETLAGIEPSRGTTHPISQIIHEISDIFERIGFEVVDGPELETEFHNFSALNIPLDHPSRDGFDTFYAPTGQLLRSQTSTVQIRVMKEQKPPLRIIAPGRVYRPDTVDASHSFMFHQIEGLMVDDRITFSDLKGILQLFLQELFGKKTRVRFRPHFFPFTEPSVEIDIQWGKKGWLEIAGAGSVHPNVFKSVGYDPKKTQGFAFGLGVERIAMLRLGIPDIRYFYENDLRFLKQF